VGQNVDSQWDNVGSTWERNISRMEGEHVQANCGEHEQADLEFTPSLEYNFIILLEDILSISSLAEYL
jgi:hypothetical protein